MISIPVAEPEAAFRSVRRIACACLYACCVCLVRCGCLCFNFVCVLWDKRGFVCACVL